MQDRFARGYLAGAIAGLVMAAINLISFKLGLAQVRYTDIAAMLIWGDLPKSTWEVIFAEVIHIASAGLLGIVFAYLLPKLESGYLLLKGSTYGAATWFLIHTAGSFFHVPILEKSTSGTTFSHLISATVYGMVLAVSLTWLESYADKEQEEEIHGKALPTPACKPLNPTKSSGK
ncbi:MAG: hypothetical protein PHU36_00180 [Syntrophomonadaceae bacterium]|nr:hypothetical protein [Syntrophomonadaceae bacterium]